MQSSSVPLPPDTGRDFLCTLPDAARPGATAGAPLPRHTVSCSHWAKLQ